MKAESTIKRELRRVRQQTRVAYDAGDRGAEDWLYGADVALSWALGHNTMAPARAFTPGRSK